LEKYKIAISAVNKCAEILSISPPEVYFADDFPNPEISSIYRYKENIIIFNEGWVNRSHEVEVIITAFHETRHAYQYHCIKTKSREDIETINFW
jgi:hypothetical protein